MSAAQDIWNEISDYRDTIHAIIGFLNFYRFDHKLRVLRDDVTVFQGRRLKPSPAKGVTAEGNPVKHVTPDFGVMHVLGRHVLGDVKKSFPQDQELWQDAFRQLMSYDDHLTGWPCPTGCVESHDVVLLTHQTRAVRVRDYLVAMEAAGEVAFERPFAIISFNQGRNGEEHYFFQKQHGGLSDKDLDDLLYEGRAVMMKVFLAEYSTVKLYDAPPPMPYLAWLIWENVINQKAEGDPKYARLRARQKVVVEVTVAEIAKELEGDFSFRRLHGDNTDYQPSIPPKEWCVKACDLFVRCKLAEWFDEAKKEKMRVYWRRIHDTLDYFVQACAEETGPPPGQLQLPGQSVD